MKKALILILVLFALAACSGGSGAVGAVETYVKALAAQDVDALTAASCAAWESDARVELDSFAAVTATVEGLSCSEAGLDGEATLVKCTGKLALDYNGELQELDLSKLTYRVVEEGGEWRMCGYK